MIGDPRDVVRADQFHVHWYREGNSDGGYGPADQYQKCVPGGVGLLEVAYRATGGAAQNISMADMIAIRERIQFGILCGYAQMEAAREWEREDWMCKCEEGSYSQLVLLASMLLWLIFALLPEARQSTAFVSDETFEVRHRGMTLSFGGVDEGLSVAQHEARVNFYEPLRRQSNKLGLYS